MRMAEYHRLQAIYLYGISLLDFHLHRHHDGREDGSSREDGVGSVAVSRLRDGDHGHRHEVGKSRGQFGQRISSKLR